MGKEVSERKTSKFSIMSKNQLGLEEFEKGSPKKHTVKLLRRRADGRQTVLYQNSLPFSVSSSD